jgi:hypothetical protein
MQQLKHIQQVLGAVMLIIFMRPNEQLYKQPAQLTENRSTLHDAHPSSAQRREARPL